MIFRLLPQQNTRLWSEISEKKIIMTEARGGMKKEFDEQLKEFYSTIEDFESSGKRIVDCFNACNNTYI